MVKNMYDPVTLDQLRALVAVVEEGSFSAAARKLKRVQSAISTSMANLETQLGVQVWDRSTKVASMTQQGQAVLAAARRVLMEVDGLRRLASGLATGLEPFVSLCVDALFPLSVLLDVCTEFAKQFPAVDLRVETEVLSAVSARVLAGGATLGVVSPLGIAPGLERQLLAAIRLIPVVGPQHPLAAVRGVLSREQIAGAVQIVLSERGEQGNPGVADQGVLSLRTWRASDLHTKHMMLRAGLGWGNLPEHLAREDLRAKRLIAIRPDVWDEQVSKLPLFGVYRSDATMGPAHRWLLDQLGRQCGRDAREGRSSAGRPKAPPKRSKKR
jgi:DNA-binding transcriptional LysR family regulator